MRSPRLLDVTAYPAITFVSGGIESSAPGSTVTGELSVRGVAARVEVVVDSIALSGRELRITAHAAIDRYSFGVTGARGLAARHLQMKFGVVAVRN